MPELQFPQLPEGGFGASHPNLGDVGNLIMHALEFPGGLVRSGLGAALRPVVGLDELSNEERFRRVARTGGAVHGALTAQNPLASALAAPPLAPMILPELISRQFGGDAAQTGAMLTGLAGETATDPLTYVGMGIPGDLLKGATPGSRMAQILETADRYDKLPAVLFDKAVAGVQRGGKIGPVTIPGTEQIGAALDKNAPAVHRVVNPAKWIQPDIVQEDRTIRQSNDLLDFLISRSKETQYRRAARQVESGSESVIAQGYNPERAVTDQKALDEATTLASRANRPVTPDDVLNVLTRPYRPNLYMDGKDVIGHYNQVYQNAYKDAPNAAVRVAVLEVQRQVDIANKVAWDATYGVYNSTSRGTARTATGRPAGAEVNEMYKQAMDRVRVNMQAGEDAIQDMVRRFSDAKLSDVEEASLTLLAHKTKSAMDAVRNTRTEGVFPAGRVETIARGAPTPVTKTTKAGVEYTPLPKIRKTRAPNDTMGLSYYEMEERIAAESQLMDALQAQVGAFLGPRAPDLEPARITSMIDRRRSEIAHVIQGEPGVLALLPEGPMSEMMSTVWPDMLRGVQKGAAAKNALEEAFGRIYETRSGSKYTPLELGKQTPEQIIAHLNRSVSDLAAGGHIPAPSAINNQADLEKFIRAFSPDEYSKLRPQLEAFPGVDLLSTDPIAASYDRAIRRLGPSYGITDPKTKQQKTIAALAGGRDVLESLYKDMTLSTGSYPVVNAMGALGNHALTGLPMNDAVERVIKSMAQHAVRPNETHYPESMDNLIKMIGEMPGGPARGFASDMASQTSQAIREMNQVGVSAWEKALPGNFNAGPIKGNATLGALGGVAGATGGNASTPSDATPEERNRNIMLGALSGATALGVAFPTRSKYIKRLAMGVEDAIRGAEWELGVRSTLVENQDAYRQVISDAFAVRQPRTTTIRPPGTPPQQYPAGNIRPSAAVEQKVLDAVDSQGYMLSPERLNAILVQADVSEAGRAQAVQRWRNLNHEANIKGQQLAGRTQFDYEDLNNFEEFMRKYVPFSTYVMKANPFFARHLMEKPIIFATLAKMQSDFDRQKRERGLTGRVSGATNFGIADSFWSQILGYNVMSYYNPLKSLFPWSNTARSMEPRQGEGPYESLLRIADLYGIPQPGPVLGGALRLAGAQGDAPPPNLIRDAGPLQGITAALGINRGKGIDIGAGMASGERTVRQAFGQDVSDPNTAATRSRIAEIYLATYGKPISEGGAEAFPFYQAIATESGPVWDHAAAQIAKEKGTKAIIGTIASPLAPQALVTDEESQIRLERKVQQVMAPEFSTRLQQAASRNPMAPANPNDVQTMRDAALYFVNREFGLDELPPKAQALLDSGTNHGVNQVRKDMVALQSDRHPLASSYVSTGGGEEARLQALLALQANQALQFPGGDILQRVNEMRRDLNMPAPHGKQFPLPTAQTSKAREALQAQHPILAAYAGWKLTHPDGSVADFIRERRDVK